MRVDAKNSRFQKAASANAEFSRAELRRCEYLLRRLRFLETKIEQGGGMANDTNGGAAHAEWESEALEWLLTEVGFLQEVDDKRGKR